VIAKGLGHGAATKTIGVREANRGGEAVAKTSQQAAKPCRKENLAERENKKLLVVTQISQIQSKQHTRFWKRAPIHRNQ